MCNEQEKNGFVVERWVWVEHKAGNRVGQQPAVSIESQLSLHTAGLDVLGIYGFCWTGLCKGAWGGLQTCVLSRSHPEFSGRACKLRV